VSTFFRVLGRMWSFAPGSPSVLEMYSTTSGTVIAMGEESGVDKDSGEIFYCRWTHVWDVDAHKGIVHSMREFLCPYFGNDEVPPMTWDHMQTTSVPSGPAVPVGVTGTDTGVGIAAAARDFDASKSGI